LRAVRKTSGETEGRVPRVDDGAVDDEPLSLLLPLGADEDRVVRLVPGQPETDGGQRIHGARRRVVAAVALGRGGGEGLQVGHFLGRVVPRLAPIGPAGRTDDGGDHLDVRVGRALHQLVEWAEVVGGIGRIRGVVGPAAGHRKRGAAPAQVHAQYLVMRGLEQRERAERMPVNLAVVVDPEFERA
jgi:hypothetical protein